MEIAIRKAADVEGNEYGLDGDVANICACVILIGVTERARDHGINYTESGVDLTSRNMQWS